MGIFSLLLMAVAWPASALGAEGLVQRCAQEELVSPVVSEATISDAGQPSQVDAVTIEIAAVPDECRGVVQRQVQYEEIKRERLHLHGGIVRRISRIQRWNTSDYRADAAGEISQSGAANPHNTRTLYRCSYKKAITKVRVKMRIVIRDANSQGEVSRKIFWGPLMEIKGINGGRGC